MRKFDLILLVQCLLVVGGRGEPQYPGGAPAGGQCGMMDQCCGMANEGCCMGGQQCYTYYENVCQNVNAQRCQPKFKQICVNEVLPDCRILKERRQQSVPVEVCKPTSKTQCFQWERTVCDMKPASVSVDVTWENEMLDQNDTQTRAKCEVVSKCKYETKESVVTEEVPRRNCTPVTESQQVCGRVPVTKVRVVEDVQYEVRYVQECQVVTQPSCSTSPCQSNGCSNGGSVCSQTEYSPQTVCAQTGSTPSDCQQVEMPVCYGNLGSCGYDQQCCSNSAREVCRQVPRRFPVRRNLTIPDVSWEERCETKEITRQDCFDTVDIVNRTKTEQICHEFEEEVCHNYTLPNYKVKMEQKTEKVSFVSRKCEFRNITEKYCHTFPQADFACTKQPQMREFILNRVVCREQKQVQFCMNIPESECKDVPDQQCRMVARKVCQPGCSTSNMCNQCDSFRNEGGFSSCSSGTCPNYFPEDPVIDANFGSGFNPGGNQGFNPGAGGGNQGYNPGGSYGDNVPWNGGNYGGDGGYGYNPGNIVTVGDETVENDWTPGGGWYNAEEPLQPLYNPGAYQPLNPGGGNQGFNPGTYQPLVPANYQPLVPGYGGGYNPGGGGSGFNPGGGGGFNPGDGDSGFNPGGGGFYTGGGGSGYNQGGSGGSGFNSGATSDSSFKQENIEALGEETEDVDRDELVL